MKNIMGLILNVVEVSATLVEGTPVEGNNQTLGEALKDVRFPFLYSKKS